MTTKNKMISRRTFLKRASGITAALLSGSALAACAQPTAEPAKPAAPAQPTAAPAKPTTAPVQPTAAPTVVKKEKVTLKWANISLTEDQFTRPGKKLWLISRKISRM